MTAIPDTHPLLLDNLAKAKTDRFAWTESSVRVMEGTGYQGRKDRTFNYDEAINEYKSWIYAAINLNATALAALPLRLFVRNASRTECSLWRTRKINRPRMKWLQGEASGPFGNARPSQYVVRKAMQMGYHFEEVTEDHPVLDLLTTVNPYFNGFDLIQLLTIYIEATGNAYLHPIIDPELGIPVELWPMPSQWVWVIPDRDHFISGYVYGHDFRNQQRFEPDEVIHIRTANPSNDGLWYGKGKIEAAWSTVRLNSSIHDMDVSMADNHARPDYLVMVKSGASQDNLDRFEANVERKLRGNRNAGRFLTISGDVQLQPLSFNSKDLSGRNEIIEEVAAVFGVPVSLLKANDPNLASAKVGYAAWKSNTILPLARLVEQRLNERLLPLFGIEDDAILAFDSPVPEDEAFALQERQTAVSGGWKTINEARIESGDQPVDDPEADVLHVGGQPLGGSPTMQMPFQLSASNERVAVQPSSPPPAPAAIVHTNSAKSIDEIVAAVRQVIQKEMANPADPIRQDLPGDGNHDPRSAEADQAQVATKVILHSDIVYKGDADDTARDDQPESPINRMRSNLATTFAALRAKVEAGILGAQFDQILAELQQAGIDLQAALAEPLTDTILSGGLRGLEQLDIPEIEIDFNVTNPAVQRFIEQHTVRLAGQISQNTLEMVRNSIEQGLAEGASTSAIADSITESGVFSPQRAEMIARTETAQAYVEGEQAGWRESGVVQGKQWLLAPDPCEFCQAIANEFAKTQLDLSGTFRQRGSTLTGTDGGVMKLDYRSITGPPLHPHCRCDLIPIVNDG